jgi:hypothetical protein
LSENTIDAILSEPGGLIMLKLPPVVLRLTPILVFFAHLSACSVQPTPEPVDEFSPYETAGSDETEGSPPYPVEETGSEEIEGESEEGTTSSGTESEGTGDPETGEEPETGDPETGEEPETGDPETGEEPETGDPETGDPETGEEPETGDPETGEDPTPDSNNGASIVQNNLPDSLPCDALTAVNIVVRNTGTTTWTRAAGYKLGIVDDEDPLYPSGTRVWLSEETVVPPDTEWTFEFSLQTPAQSGVFFSDWQMIQEDVEWFGEIASRDIAVDCPTEDVPAPTEYTEADEAEVYATAVKVKQEHPEYFDIEDLDDFTKRSLAYEMMTLNLNDLRSKGVNASRCVANPGLPESDPFLWCSDALVVGSPGFGTTIDIYQSWSYPGIPQTAVTEEGGQTGIVTSDLIPLP